MLGLSTWKRRIIEHPPHSFVNQISLSRACDRLYRVQKKHSVNVSYYLVGGQEDVCGWGLCRFSALLTILISLGLTIMP